MTHAPESGAANPGRSRLSGGSSVTLEKLVTTTGVIETAADNWDATSLNAIGNTLSTLEGSASDLSEFLEIMQGSPAVPADTFRTSLLNLKRAAARMERLVDASSAFLRGAALYQPGEAADETAPVTEARGIEV